MGFNKEGILKDARDEFRTLINRMNAAVDLIIAGKASILTLRDVTIPNNPTLFTQEHIDDVNTALAALNERKGEF